MARVYRYDNVKSLFVNYRLNDIKENGKVTLNHLNYYVGDGWYGSTCKILLQNR